MNYYRHHIGDYLRDTAHLSMLEDAAYRRLLDLYYMREQPIPADPVAACRLIRARGDDECSAVRAVLEEFFTLEDDGWHQKRADGEIALARREIANRRAFWSGIPREVKSSLQASRRALSRSATPAWLNCRQRQDIAAAYRAARAVSAQSGQEHQVDHIIPLRGKSVCGLHVPWNLRVIPAEQNRAKGNHLIAEVCCG